MATLESNVIGWIGKMSGVFLTVEHFAVNLIVVCGSHVANVSNSGGFLISEVSGFSGKPYMGLTIER